MAIFPASFLLLSLWHLFLVRLKSQMNSVLDESLVTTALKEDRGELIDLLDRLDVTALPTQQNLNVILVKVAHKQLI